MSPSDVTPYLERIRAVFPSVKAKTARLNTRDGQFNDILIVDEELIFRASRKGAKILWVPCLSVAAADSHVLQNCQRPLRGP